MVHYKQYEFPFMQTNKKEEIFTKHDNGKPSFHIVQEFTEDLGLVNKVLEYGADKYGMDNWKNGKTPEHIRRMRDAATRHLLASYRDSIDNESGNKHIHHAITNLLFISWHERT